MSSSDDSRGKKRTAASIDMDASTLRKLQRHFDGIAEAYYDIVDQVWYEFGYFHRKELGFLSASMREKCVLAVDAGCGPGRHTLTLAAFAERVVAIDLSREMLRQAKGLTANRAANVEFVQADIRQLPLKAAVADLAVNFEVLEHIPGGKGGVSRALRELRRVLRRGGDLITEAPLLLHAYVNLILPPTMKELESETVRRHYERAPLVVAESQRRREIETALTNVGFTIAERAFVRVLPSGLVERFPRLTGFDAILERVPLVQRLAREAIWLAEAV